MNGYVFIDGNNLGIRTAFTNRDLTVSRIDYSSDFNPDDTLDPGATFPTGCIHGFFRTLMAVRRSRPDYYIAVVWDSKCEWRMDMTKTAVAEGIVPGVYKGNRKGVYNPAVDDFHKQRPVLQRMLSLTNIPQIMKKGEEADDVIASLARRHSDCPVIMLTTDKDYYQLLDDAMLMKSEENVLDHAWFVNEFGIEPWQWVEVGSLMGDDGDNIYGIPNWGEKTAITAIAEHGTAEAVLKSLHEKYDDLRTAWPDVYGDNIAELAAIEVGPEKSRRQKYPEIFDGMPFSGVALAVERKEKKVKIPMKALFALMYEHRTPLAKSLKKMKRDIPLPELVDLGRECEEEFLALCLEYELSAVSRDATTLCRRQVGFQLAEPEPEPEPVPQGPVMKGSLFG